MEKLEAYLAANGIRQSQFAERIGVTQATVSKLIAGSVAPSLALAVRIQRETFGAVPCDAWVRTSGQDAA